MPLRMSRKQFAAEGSSFQVRPERLARTSRQQALYDKIEKELIRDKEQSDRVIAEALRVSPTTVGKVRRGLGWLGVVEKRKGADGKHRIGGRTDWQRMFDDMVAEQAAKGRAFTLDDVIAMLSPPKGDESRRFVAWAKRRKKKALKPLA